MSTFSIWHWIIVVIFYLPFPILVAWLCPKAGRKRGVWVPLTLLPFLGPVFLWILLTLTVGKILDRANGSCESQTSG